MTTTDEVGELVGKRGSNILLGEHIDVVAGAYAGRKCVGRAEVIGGFCVFTRHGRWPRFGCRLEPRELQQ
jgi:hypothetical protein